MGEVWPIDVVRAQYVTTPRTTENDRIMSDNGRTLRRLLTSGSDLRHQNFQAVLELAVLGGIDQRVDTAVGEHQHHGQVVQPASEVDRTPRVVEKVHDFDWRPTGEEHATYYQRRDNCIPSCFGKC